MMVISSCSLTKNLDDDDQVYMGTNITVEDREQGKSVEKFNFNLGSVAKTGTKNGLGNFYIGLHNIFKDAPPKGFKNWVKNKLGNKPVLYTPDIEATTEARLKFYLNGKGYFSHSLSCDTVSHNRKVDLNCNIKLDERYRIDSLIFPLDSSYVALELDENKKRTIIREQNYYDRDRLDFERLRLTTLAGDMGFADFNINNVYYYVDTAHVDNTVDIYLQILSPTDSTSHIRYTLDSIRIYPNYSLKSSNAQLTAVPVGDGITVYENDHYLSHQLIDQLILEDPDWYYNRTLELKSINRLQNLGLFRFINVVNEPSKNGKRGHITQNIYLTPTEMQSISGELELNNRSGNFVGTGASGRYQHKNLFGHAENLNLSIGGQVETQFGDGVSLINSSDFSAEAEISFPRFIVPFIKLRENRNYIPRTIVKTNYTNQRRTSFYTINSLTTKIGYSWRESFSKLHEFYPINLNQLRVSGVTPEFQDILNNDLRLSRSFDNFLIGGLQYYFTYTDQVNRNDRNHNYLKVEVETSGNLLSIITGANKANPREVAGLKFAQYSKITFDYRKYFELKKSDLAARVIMGIGGAYGNSEEIPYVKQYIIGGSNSIRAYRLRGLGPGTFLADTVGLTALESQFVDQTGDLKLEMNVEYRFPVFNYLKSAVFIDAGNIWLLDNKERPEGNFKFNEFYKQIGIGTGLGLRLDFDFFLIRLDIAFPLRGPTANGFEWMISDIDLFSQSWRKDNVRYNLGIGYPF